MSFFEKLEQLIRERKEHLPENSYTAKLFKSGLDRILRKVGEESGEVIIAAKNADRQEFKGEVADLIYHLMVLLREKDMSWQEVEDVLKARHH